MIVGLKMSIVSKIFKKVMKRTWTKAMDRLGGRLVSRMADTSSDAPNAFHKPKRDLYDQIRQQEIEEQNKKR